MEDEEIKNFGESNTACLIDVSSEDDCLINSPSVHQQEQPLEDHNGQRSGDSMNFVRVDRREAINAFEVRQGSHQMSESIEPNAERKFGKCNLRKSLAWDKAFFTSDGVLDPEELSMIGVGNSNYNNSLQGIQEDVQQSNDSISSLDSDDMSLENIEANLFVDARASIQKTMATNSKNPSANSTRAETKTHLISLKKVDGSSSGRVNVNKSVLKKSSSVIQGPRKITQSLSFTHATQPGTKIKMPTVLPPKPPKVARINVVPSPQAKPVSRSVPSSPQSKPLSKSGIPAQQIKPLRKGDGRESFETAYARGRGTPLSKCPPRASDFHRRISADTACSGTQGLNMPTLCKSPSRPSSAATLIKKKDKAFGASCSLIGGSSSNAAASGNIHKSLTNFPRKKIDSKIPIPGAPTRTTLRHKTEPESPNLSAYIKSIPKPLSSSISSDSSISEWSSETSSSTSAINRNSKAFAGETTRGCSELAKSSGLRMPSPKIGFFDKANSAAGQVPNRKKFGKLQISGTAPSSQTIKIASQENVKSMSPVPVKNESAPLEKSSSKIPTLSDQNDHPLEGSLVGAETGKHVLDCNFNAEGKGGESGSKNKKGTELIIHDANIDSQENMKNIQLTSLTQLDSTKPLSSSKNGRESHYTSSEVQRNQSVEIGEKSDMKKSELGEDEGTRTSEYVLDSGLDAVRESGENSLNNTSDIIVEAEGSMFVTTIQPVHVHPTVSAESSDIGERSNVKKSELRVDEETETSEYVLDSGLDAELEISKSGLNIASDIIAKVGGSMFGTSFKPVLVHPTVSAESSEIEEISDMKKSELGGDEETKTSEYVLEVEGGSDMNKGGLDVVVEGIKTSECLWESDLAAEGKNIESGFMIETSGDMANNTDLVQIIKPVDNPSAPSTESSEIEEEFDTKKTEFSLPEGTITSEYVLDSDIDAEGKGCECGLKNNSSDATADTQSSTLSTSIMHVQDPSSASRTSESENMKMAGLKGSGGTKSSECVLESVLAVEGKSPSIASTSKSENMKKVGFRESEGTESFECVLESDLAVDGKSPLNASRTYESENMKKAGLRGSEGSESSECVLESDLAAEGKICESGFMIEISDAIASTQGGSSPGTSTKPLDNHPTSKLGEGSYQEKADLCGVDEIKLSEYVLDSNFDAEVMGSESSLMNASSDEVANIHESALDLSVKRIQAFPTVTSGFGEESDRKCGVSGTEGTDTLEYTLDLKLDTKGMDLESGLKDSTDAMNITVGSDMETPMKPVIVASSLKSSSGCLSGCYSAPRYSPANLCTAESLSESSGLRMPSPNIGLFDEGNSVAVQFPNTKRFGKVQISGATPIKTVLDPPTTAMAAEIGGPDMNIASEYVLVSYSYAERKSHQCGFKNDPSDATADTRSSTLPIKPVQDPSNASRNSECENMKKDGFRECEGTEKSSECVLESDLEAEGKICESDLMIETSVAVANNPERSTHLIEKLEPVQAPQHTSTTRELGDGSQMKKAELDVETVTGTHGSSVGSSIKPVEDLLTSKPCGLKNSMDANAMDITEGSTLKTPTKPVPRDSSVKPSSGCFRAHCRALTSLAQYSSGNSCDAECLSESSGARDDGIQGSSNMLKVMSLDTDDEREIADCFSSKLHVLGDGEGEDSDSYLEKLLQEEFLNLYEEAGKAC